MKKTSNMSWFAACFAPVVFAFALTGCGGGAGSSSTPTGGVAPEEEPTEEYIAGEEELQGEAEGE